MPSVTSLILTGRQPAPNFQAPRALVATNTEPSALPSTNPDVPVLSPNLSPGKADRALTTMSFHPRNPLFRTCIVPRMPPAAQPNYAGHLDTTPTEWNPVKTLKCASELCEPQAASRRIFWTYLRGRPRQLA